MLTLIDSNVHFKGAILKSPNSFQPHLTNPQEKVDAMPSIFEYLNFIHFNHQPCMSLDSLAIRLSIFCFSIEIQIISSFSFNCIFNFHFSVVICGKPKRTQYKNTKYKNATELNAELH